MNLDYLEYFINVEIPKQLRKSPVFSRKTLDTISLGRVTGDENMDREFVKKLSQLPNEDALRTAVRACQYTITPLLDKLMQWIPEEHITRMYSSDKKEDRYWAFKYLHQQLYDLHTHLESNFGRYIDQAYKLPAYDLYLFQEFIIGKLVVVKSSPQFRSLDNHLQQIVIRPLEISASANADNALTYRGRRYAEKLADELTSFVKGGEEDVWELYNRLQFIDFNSADYVRYLTAQFTGQYALISSYREKYIWLIDLRKKIAHQLVRDGISLKPGQRSLKEMLDEWLKWEIYYVKRMMELETRN